MNKTWVGSRERGAGYRFVFLLCPGAFKFPALFISCPGVGTEPVSLAGWASSSIDRPIENQEEEEGGVGEEVDLPAQLYLCAYYADSTTNC